MNSCTTGNAVPQGTWQIFQSRKSCCEAPSITSYSACNPSLETSKPTKHPTISKVEGDDFEIVPIRFDLSGLPTDVKMKDLRQEMLTVLKRILIRLSEKIDGLKVSEVEERSNRYLRDLLSEEEEELLSLYESMTTSHSSLRNDDGQWRRSLGEASLMYDVYVVRDEGGRKFGPVIIDYMKQNYGEVLEQIQTSPDINYFNSDDVEMNFCTSENGRYSNCVYSVDMAPPPSPSSVTVNNNRPTVVNNKPSSTSSTMYGSSPTTINVQSNDNDDGGLAGWAVFLIILFVMIILCCIGYAVFFFCCGGRDRHRTENHTTKEVNNVYFDERSGNHTTREANNDYFDERSHDAPSYYSRRSRSAAPSRKEAETAVVVVPQRQGRDPTSYVPGQEDKPDPDENASRRYYPDADEDPPTKAKRDPTMYVEGHGDDPSVYSSRSYMEDPPLKAKRDPTMYVEGNGRDPTMYFEGHGGRDPTVYFERDSRDTTMYVDDSTEPSVYGDGGVESSPEDGYHDYSMSDMDDESFRTQHRSVSERSSGKSSKGKHSSRTKKR